MITRVGNYSVSATLKSSTAFYSVGVTRNSVEELVQRQQQQRGRVCVNSRLIYVQSVLTAGGAAKLSSWRTELLPAAEGTYS